MTDAARGSPERQLSGRALDRRLAELQAQAFAIYETASAHAEAAPATAEAAYAHAEREAAPLIEEARRVNDERVRRLRQRARAWKSAAWTVALAGLAGLTWWLETRG